MASIEENSPAVRDWPSGWRSRHLAPVARLTEQQQAAVVADGDVLVMAGAGTGKTHTLVERVLHFALRPEQPVALDRFLIVTFTEAATAELQRRLTEALTKRHEEAPADAWIAAQLARLDHAMIGTLHGYCLRLLREHFHELGLDPALQTLDEADARRLQEQTLAALWEPAYLGTDPFSEAVRDLWQGQFNGDPRSAGAALRDLHSAVRALEDPTEWLRTQDEYWAQDGPVAWRSDLLREITGWAAGWLMRLGGATDNPAAATNPNLAARLPVLAALAELSSGPDRWSAATAALDRLREKKDEAWLPRQKTRLRAPLANLFSEAAAWAGWMSLPNGDRDPLREDWQWSRHRMQTVLALWRRFDAEYSRRKRERLAVDFADQEHFALDLLGRADQVGRTLVAAGERLRFDCVLVDECQDLNAAQDAVLRAVSRCAGGPGAEVHKSGNRFLVGDVKQSIYRFRRADPVIFQRYAQEWSRPGAPGRVLTLNENFRSAASVLAFVNGVFPWLLRPELGGVAFGADAALQFGAPESRAALAGDEPRVEVHVRVTGGTDAEDRAGEEPAADDAAADISKTEREASLVAARLRELHASELPVWDKHLQQLRPVRWSDMAVLLRGKQSRAEDFGKAFAAQGVPLQAGAGGFFDRAEIRDLCNLVAALDNPLQDVPLVGLLRSPFGSLTESDQLAAIRLVRRRPENTPGEAPERWWTLLRHFIEVGRSAVAQPVDTLPAPLINEERRATLSGAEVFSHPATAAAARTAWSRADLFVQRFAVWRHKAARGSIAFALEAALDDTGFEAAYRHGPDGVAANANIQRFLELARHFDQHHSGGAAAFLHWLEGQRESESIAAALPGGTEAVALLTIHKSKGLEFPVVAVASLGTTFNESDFRGAEWILDSQVNLAPRIHPPAGGSYPGPTFWLAQRRQRREQWGEEMRLLYVALTRAADRLLLFGTTTATRIDHWHTAEAVFRPPLPVAELEAARCPLEWLARAFGRWQNVDWKSGGKGETPFFHWRIWDESEEPSSPPLIFLATPETPDVPVTTEVTPTYPHTAATREPAKATVTGLRKRRQAAEDEESGRLTLSWSNRGPVRVADDDELRVDGSAPADVNAVERGLLHHRFMEHVDPARTESDAELATELARLVTAGRFTSIEAAALDARAIARFWAGPLGSDIRQRTGEVRRELPFTLRLSVGDLSRLEFHPDPGLAAEEFIVVQGVIDLVCFAGDTAWILDFKTDRVRPGIALTEKAAAYAPQLALYALAVERLFGRSVTGAWLHFLDGGTEINVLPALPEAGNPV